MNALAPRRIRPAAAMPRTVTALAAYDTAWEAAWRVWLGQAPHITVAEAMATVDAYRLQVAAAFADDTNGINNRAEAVAWINSEAGIDFARECVGRLA